MDQWDESSVCPNQSNSGPLSKKEREKEKEKCACKNKWQKTEAAESTSYDKDKVTERFDKI